MPSKIEWTEQTWNPLAGCSPVSEGCRNCYAIRQAHRLASMGNEKYAGTTRRFNGKTVWTGQINLDEEALKIPLRRKRPTTYFVNSMSDLFHPDVPFDFIDRVFAVMALCPQHTFQVLTKRPERALEYLTAWRQYKFGGKWSTRAWVEGSVDEVFASCWGDWLRKRGVLAPTYTWPLKNVWLGTSVESPEHLDRVDRLLQCPASVRFLSLEPLLAPIQLPRARRYTPDADLYGVGRYTIHGIHWVIVGGESGPGARPCRSDWVRSIIQQCQSASVPCFVKQLGSRFLLAENDIQRGCSGVAAGLNHPKGGDPTEWPEDLRVREMPVTEKLICTADIE